MATVSSNQNMDKDHIARVKPGSTAMGGVGFGANTVEDKDHMAQIPQQSSTSLEGVGTNPLKGMDDKDLARISQQIYEGGDAAPVKADDPPVQKSTIGSAKDIVGSATSTVRDTVGSATSSVRDTVGATTDSVKDTVGSTTSSVKDTVGAATTTVKDTVNAAIGATIEAVKGTYDTIVGSNTTTDANKNQKVVDDSGETKVPK
ncbi:hypothetical protein C2G38_2139308 [Gigaspora rosea]|uniref:Uncharacterized protein n=1 Tax=Gigaspora rosea TaxID=44941 RepID=A0A397VWC3_9GLOM|nr:hypothetical protein C2G38_2139308 [Gigaspora rosea]